MRGSIIDHKIIRHDGTCLNTKHTFKELEDIEDERRKILKRVSLVVEWECACSTYLIKLDAEITISKFFTGRTTSLENHFIQEWNLYQWAFTGSSYSYYDVDLYWCKNLCSPS